MEKREGEAPQSTLPESLRPHLIVAPGQPRDSPARPPLPGSRVEGEATGETDTLPLRLGTPPPLRPAAFDDEAQHISRAHSGYPSGSQEPDDANRGRASAAGHSAYSGLADQRSSAHSFIRYGHALHYSTPNLGHPVHVAPSHFDSPNDPIPPPGRGEPGYLRQWGEGEAGPSRLRRGQRETAGHSYPSRVVSEASGMPTTDRSTNLRGSYSSGDSTGLEGEVGRSIRDVTISARESTSYRSIQETPSQHPLRTVSSMDPFGRREIFSARPAREMRRVSSMGENMGSGQSRESSDRPIYPLIPAAVTPDPVKTEDDVDVSTISQRGRKRQDSEDSTELEQSPKKKTPRKAPVACNFCRGRKLRCDTTRPSCGNCSRRHLTCVYVDFPRRRGPGRAPKGTRSKKRARPSESLSSQPPLGEHRKRSGGDFDFDTRAAELKSKVSVASLETLSSQVEGPPPPYTKISEITIPKGTRSKPRSTKARPSASSSSQPFGDHRESSGDDTELVMRPPERTQRSTTFSEILSSQRVGTPPPYTAISETMAHLGGLGETFGHRASSEASEPPEPTSTAKTTLRKEKRDEP